MLLQASPEVVSCRDQYSEFCKDSSTIRGEILRFAGVARADVYNPSVPFEFGGETVLAGRVETRDSEASQTIFFVERENVWVPLENTPAFPLQDPFVTRVGEELILGGVRVVWENDRIVSWVTDFYRGKNLRDLKLFATGPSHMKDIRLIELPDGKIGIFSRPQGSKMLEQYGCIAKIGFTTVASLNEVTAEAIENAPLLTGPFLPDEWGGCNQLHLLRNGLIGVIGHKAYGVKEGSDLILHYYSIAFAINPQTRKMSPDKFICSRECFPDGPAKHHRVKDVTFTAGLVRNGDGTATLYTGLSDCQVGRVLIPDPLLEYEK